MSDEKYIDRLKKLVQPDEAYEAAFKVYANYMQQHTISKDLDNVVPMQGKGLVVVYEVGKARGLLEGCNREQFVQWTECLIQNAGKQHDVQAQSAASAEPAKEEKPQNVSKSREPNTDVILAGMIMSLIKKKTVAGRENNGKNQGNNLTDDEINNLYKDSPETPFWKR